MEHILFRFHSLAIADLISLGIGKDLSLVREYYLTSASETKINMPICNLFGNVSKISKH